MSSTTTLLDTLYCEEQENGFLDEYIDENTPQNLTFLGQDFSWEDEELALLFAKENEEFCGGKLVGSLGFGEGQRCEVVDWILRVVGHYGFGVKTGVVAVEFLDRFVGRVEVRRGRPWMVWLAAVSCLSVAAKVEETHVPLLLDLQVEDCKYVFEAKTIQRMEIFVLSTLGWKMYPVTPLSFIDYITRRLGLESHLCWEFLKRCECLVLCFISDQRYICHLPSVIATAIVLQVINGVEPLIGLEYEAQLLSILGIDKDKLEECSKIIRGLTCGRGGRDFLRSYNKRKFGSVPGSPNGVMDLCFSSDSSNDSWAATAAAASVSSSPEPLSKKSKLQEHACIPR